MEWYNFDFLSEHCYIISFDQLLILLWFYHLVPVQNQVVKEVWSTVHNAGLSSLLVHKTKVRVKPVYCTAVRGDALCRPVNMN